MNATADDDSQVIVVGAGPVGMLPAYQLDRLGVACLIVDNRLQKAWSPKMDLTNCRNMEILRCLGLAEDLRAQQGAVSADANFDSIFVTSLESGGHLLGSWVSFICEHHSKALPLMLRKLQCSGCHPYSSIGILSSLSIMAASLLNQVKDVLRSFSRNG
jgi:hypothetical protein